MVTTNWSKRAKTQNKLDTWEEATYTWAEAVWTWEGWTPKPIVSSDWQKTRKHGYLLNEDGSFILWEDGSKILLLGTDVTWGNKANVSTAWDKRPKPVTNYN